MFIVQYTGPFAFIKPWTAVRDELTFSQQFLTPSIVIGIEQKLFPELIGNKNYEHKIIRHKLIYSGQTIQLEQTQIRGIKIQKKQNLGMRSRSIIKRGILLSPKLYLAFSNKDDAKRAIKQHICLCRNEDILLPLEVIIEMTEQKFSALNGFELHFKQTTQSFMVGYNRFKNGAPMFGWLEMTNNPKESFDYE